MRSTLTKINHTTFNDNYNKNGGIINPSKQGISRTFRYIEIVFRRILLYKSYLVRPIYESYFVRYPALKSKL